MTTHPASIMIATVSARELRGFSPIPDPIEYLPNDLPGMMRATWKFDNGFGASVIAGPALGYVELAVLDVNGDITYTTSVTDDVEHPENEAELMDLLVRIMNL